MRKKYFFIMILSSISIRLFAQHPFKHWTDAVETRYDNKQPIVIL